MIIDREMMPVNKRNHFVFAVVVSLAFLTVSCEYTGEGTGGFFDYELRGTWESNDKTVYSGKITIDYDSITITGYTRDQGNRYWPPDKRPFVEFPRNVALSGYSEEGRIYIFRAGVYEGGIPYAVDDPGPGKPLVLWLTFGAGEEIMVPVETLEEQ